ncbi:MAG: hypothetical protein ABI120_16305 [Gemmatimonadaceae bacterium]
MGDKFILDPRLSGVKPEVLQKRKDSPIRLRSPALEYAAIQLSAITSPFGRPLTPTERDIVDDIFKSSVDAGRVRIVEAHILNAPTTLGNQIRVPYGWNFDGDRRAVLVHEFGHIWQYQTQGTGYITDSVYHNASGQIATGNRNVAYMNYQLRDSSSFSDFTAEEQATIIGDYYEMTRIYAGVKNPPAWVGLRSPDLPIYERMIRHVRGAVSRSDTKIYSDSLMFQPNNKVPDLNARPGEGFTPMIPLLEFRFGK